MSDKVIGVDIGGTKVAAGLVELDGEPRLLQVCRTGTPTAGGAAVLDVVTAMLKQLSGSVRGAGIRAIGVAAPGIVDHRAGVVRSAGDTLRGWAGIRITETLSARFGLPVSVDNDVRALAVGEAHYGAARDFDSCLVVCFGTGVGGAVIQRRNYELVLRGTRSSAGEVAHLVCREAGAMACGCGSMFHLEAIASGPAIAAEYEKRAHCTANLHVVAARLAAGDEMATEVVTRAGRLAGETIAGVVSAFDLDGVILGGGALEVGPALEAAFAASLRAAIWPRGRKVLVTRCALGSSAALIGAASLTLARGSAPHVRLAGSWRE